MNTSRAAPLLACSLLGSILCGDVLAAEPVATSVTVLVCDGPGACAEDEAWVKAAGVDAGLPLVAADALLELDSGGWTDGVDQRGRYRTALVLAKEAAAKGQWKIVGEAMEEARDALDRWKGRPETEELFAVAYLEGTARFHKGKDQGYQASFREAAGIANGRDPDKFPFHDPEVEHAFLEELRKVAVGGTGTLALGGVPADATVFIDGREVKVPPGGLPLFPGAHRLNVIPKGAVRSWQATVPILAERTSAVVVRLNEKDNAGWVRDRIVQGFDAMTLPAEVAEILRDWSVRSGYASLRLVRVEPTRRIVQSPAVGMTAAPRTRPAAAAGERVDFGDGVPGTFDDLVVARYEEARAGHVQDGPRRVRVAWFEPLSGRLLQDAPRTYALEDAPEQPVRAGVHLGFASVMGDPHAAIDLQLIAQAGPIWIDGRVGIIRGSEPYRLYRGWTDRQLYHALVAASWHPDWRVAPVVALGPEVYVPVAVGGRGMVGVDVALGWNLRMGVEADLGLLSTGMTWGLGGGVSRGF